jgi:hypothetical protein
MEQICLNTIRGVNAMLFSGSLRCLEFLAWSLVVVAGVGCASGGAMTLADSWSVLQLLSQQTVTVWSPGCNFGNLYTTSLLYSNLWHRLAFSWKARAPAGSLQTPSLSVPQYCCNCSVPDYNTAHIHLLGCAAAGLTLCCNSCGRCCSQLLCAYCVSPRTEDYCNRGILVCRNRQHSVYALLLIQFSTSACMQLSEGGLAATG